MLSDYYQHKPEFTDIKETYQIQVFAQFDWQLLHEIQEFDYNYLKSNYEEACKKFSKPIRMVKHHYCPHGTDWEETLWYNEEKENV